MATPSQLISTTEPTQIAPPMSTAIASAPVLKHQPLWRFALVGLGPLTAMGLLALVLAFLQRTT